MSYQSARRASVVTVVLTLSATALWSFVVPVAESWHEAWLVRPPAEIIPLWKRLAMYFAQGWPIVWPAFVVFVWVMTFLPVELYRRIKVRRLTESFIKEYQTKTDEELLRLALGREQLTAEANAPLASELTRRRIDDPERLRAFREEEQKRKGARVWGPELIARSPVTGREPYTVGPPSPADAPKAPWRPKVAGWIAFFLGPVAGAIVSAISLRRMGHYEKAKKVFLLTLLAAAAEATLLFSTPDNLSSMFGLLGEVAFLLIFPSLQNREFREWEAGRPDAMPSSGWKAIGWGLAGSALFLVIVLAVFVVLARLLVG